MTTEDNVERSAGDRFPSKTEALGGKDPGFGYSFSFSGHALERIEMFGEYLKPYSRAYSLDVFKNRNTKFADLVASALQFGATEQQVLTCIRAMHYRMMGENILPTLKESDAIQKSIAERNVKVSSNFVSQVHDIFNSRGYSPTLGHTRKAFVEATFHQRHANVSRNIGIRGRALANFQRVTLPMRILIANIIRPSSVEPLSAKPHLNPQTLEADTLS
ncbi:MAG: hypothetical protein L6Q57_03905 [Alphaproteobacteria bacterium]|nr:hypothetical protein [Alphaproteobacteria bacterium]